MKHTSAMFPRKLQMAGRGGGNSGREELSGVSWMLVRWWRVAVRRVLLVTIALLFMYTMAVVLLLMIPLTRIPSLQTATYFLMSFEQIAWLCVLAAAFYTYSSKRRWLPKVTGAVFLLVFLKGIGLVALNLDSIWCSRPEFGERYMFTVPLNVVCVNGTCSLPVQQNERPQVCAVMEMFSKEMADRDANIWSIARVFFSHQLLQTFLAVAIIVHAIEDQVRLGY